MPDSPHPTLDREVVLQAAVDLADEIGIAPLTIRKLAERLGSKPMTLYGHVKNKDDILDGMVDVVFGEIDPPPTDLPWRDALAHRCRSARRVLARHGWAVPLLESRTTPGPRTLAHHEAVLACLYGAGFPHQVVAHAYAVTDAFVYGFAIQESSLPGTSADDGLGDVASELLPRVREAFPHLARFTEEHALQAGYAFGASFEVGLGLVLDGIERLAAARAVGT